MSRTIGSKDRVPRKRRADAGQPRKAIANAQPTEKEILAAVLAHWKALGNQDTLIATIPNAGAFGQLGLTKGLPDLIVLGHSIPGRIGFIELKRIGGKPSPAQEEFQARCVALGISHAITYGRDEPIYVLEGWGVLKPRHGD
jgi:hypothetical protein